MALYNIIIDQGSDYSVSLVLSDSGVVRDLTGYLARAQMRKTSYSIVVATFACTIPTPTDGEIFMELDNDTSSALTPGVYVYDLELYTAGDAEVARLIGGKVTVTAEITK